jgi:RNA polymerase sigma factor for flagellar operon FliA
MASVIQPQHHRMAHAAARAASGDHDELYQAAMLALVIAAARHNADRASFGTFAHHRIRGAVIDEMRRMDWLPSAVRRQYPRIEHARHTLEQRHGRPAKSREIAAELGPSIERYHRLARYLHAGHIESTAEQTTEPAAHQPSALDAVQDSERSTQLAAAVARLTTREQTLVRWLYHDDMPQAEAATALGITPSRICQIHRQILAKLRRRVTSCG